MVAVLTGAHTAINWDDPLAKGLFCYVVHPHGGRPVELTKRYTLSYSGTAAWGGGAGAYGPASVHTNTGSSGFELLSGALSGTVAGSILVIRRRTDGLNRATGIGSNATGTNSFGVLLPFSDGTVYWDFGGNAGTNRISKSGLSFSAKDSVWIFTAGPSGMYMYQDGLLVASSSSAPSARVPHNTTFGLTYGNSQAGSDNRVDTLYVAADRQWSPTEVAQWTANPFRVAELPRGRRFITIGAAAALASNVVLTPATATTTAIAAASVSTGPPNDITLVPAGDPFPRFREKLKQVMAGTASLTIAAVGDSTSIGHGSTDAPTKNAYARVAARYSKATTLYNASFGTGGTTGDTRVTLGAGWARGSLNAIAGGGWKGTSGGGGTLSFVPAASFDTLKVWWLRQSGAGSATVNVDGGSSLGTITGNGATSVQSTTYTVTAGTHTVNIVGPTGGDLFIIGIETYTAATAAVRINNYGLSGSAVGDWDDDTNAWDTLKVLRAFAPDLTFVNLTINDIKDGLTTTGNYTTAMSAIVSALNESGDVALTVGNRTNDADDTDLRYQSFVNALMTVGTIMFSVPNRWGSYTTANASGFMSGDGIHPNDTGYNDIATGLLAVLDSVVPTRAMPLSVSTTPAPTTQSLTAAATTTTARSLPVSTSTVVLDDNPYKWTYRETGHTFTIRERA